MLVLFGSCSKSISSECLSNGSVILRVNTAIELRSDIRLIIKDCFKKYFQYNSFVLSRCPRKLNTDDFDEIFSNDFLIGPAFNQSFFYNVTYKNTIGNESD